MTKPETPPPAPDEPTLLRLDVAGLRYNGQAGTLGHGGAVIGNQVVLCIHCTPDRRWTEQMKADAGARVEAVVVKARKAWEGGPAKAKADRLATDLAAAVEEEAEARERVRTLKQAWRANLRRGEAIGLAEQSLKASKADAEQIAERVTALKEMVAAARKEAGNDLRGEVAAALAALTREAGAKYKEDCAKLVRMLPTVFQPINFGEGVLQLAAQVNVAALVAEALPEPKPATDPATLPFGGGPVPAGTAPAISQSAGGGYLAGKGDHFQPSPHRDTTPAGHPAKF
jgi:hypothetical protein